MKRLAAEAGIDPDDTKAVRRYDKKHEASGRGKDDAPKIMAPSRPLPVGSASIHRLAGLSY